MLKTFHIIKHSRGTEEESKLKTLIVELSEIKYWGHSKEYATFSPEGTQFIFLLESRIAKRILNQVITDPIELDMNDFEIGDLNLGFTGDVDVHMHKDYVKKRKPIESLNIDYEEIFNISKDQLAEIPLPLYEHLYRYVAEDAPLEKAYSFNSIAYHKSKVPLALITATSDIFNKMIDILVHNGSIEDLKNIVEHDFKRSGFGNLKHMKTDSGNEVDYFETMLKTFSQVEQKILFFGLIKHKETGENLSVIIKSSKGFWDLLVFISAIISNRAWIHYGSNKCVSASFNRTVATFQLIENQLYQFQLDIVI